MKVFQWCAVLAAIGTGLASISGATAPASVMSAEGAATTSRGADKVYLKDGTVIEGEITREVEGWVWIKRTTNGVDEEVTLDPKNISKIERASKGAAAEPARPAPDAAKPKPRDGGGPPRAAILTMEGTVGIQMCRKPLDDALPLLRKDGVNIVIFKIKSGGGLLLEIQRLSDVIENEYKKDFTVVAWIDSAISAAAMTAHTFEDIYFMPQGSYGGCVGFSGQLEAMKGRSLEEALYMMEKISARGKHPKEIMRAMQVPGEDEALGQLDISPPSGKLSADIDEKTGEVTWYQDHSGKNILNPKTGEFKILTFHSAEAVKFKFARGIAQTHQELVKQMGYNEVEWVGKAKNDYAWPVSEAEELQIKWRKNATDAEDNFGVYVNDYGRNVQTAQGISDKAERAPWIAKARTALNKLRALAKEQPNLKLLRGLRDQWFEQQDDLLRKLAK